MDPDWVWQNLTRINGVGTSTGGEDWVGAWRARRMAGPQPWLLALALRILQVTMERPQFGREWACSTVYCRCWPATSQRIQPRLLRRSVREASRAGLQ